MREVYYVQSGIDLKREIEDDAFKIYSSEFESSITEYFGPVEREDQ